MRRTFAAILILLCAGVRLEARDHSLLVRWPDLAPQVNGMKISTVLQDGSRVEGRAISVEPEALIVMVARSSSQAYGKGKSTLPRTSVSSIRVSHTGWKWKVIGPIAGFVGMGALGGAVGNRVDRGGFIFSDGAAVGALAGMVTGIVAGALIGRWADHHYVTITIAP